MPAFHLSSLPRRGFSLVELSIVLVIIGLIIAGIMGGQELVASAKLQNVTKQASEIRDAVGTFRQKYGDLPGDMPDAVTYWPSCTDTTNNTCNGNGNGKIFESSGSGFLSERYRAWQHLSLSGIIPGKFTGQFTSTVPGTTVLGGALANSYFLIGWYQELAFNNNFIQFQSTSGPALTSVQARSIDQKVDDGLAYSGRVVGTQSSNNAPPFGCPYWDASTSTFGTTYDYNIGRTAKECVLFYNWIDLRGQS